MNKENFENYVLGTFNWNLQTKNLHFTMLLIDENWNQQNLIPFVASLEPKIKKIETKQVEKTRPTLEEVVVDWETYLKKWVEKYFETETIETDELVDNPNYISPDFSTKDLLDYAKKNWPFNWEK